MLFLRCRLGRVECSEFFAQVLQNGEPLTVVNLGGGHDLGDNLPVSVEYIRVQTMGHHAAVSETVAVNSDR